MATRSAAVMARKGAGMIFSGVSAISQGISKVRKNYANKHEAGVLDEIRQKGLNPVDLLFQALQRVYFLYMAGYKHELAAAAKEAGKRLTDAERSSIPLDAVLVFVNAVSEEAQKYGSFEKGKFAHGLQDLVNKSRMGNEHYDRSSISHDIYYSILTTAETHGTEWHNLERVFREATARVIGNAIHASEGTKDARTKAAKALYAFASEIRIVAQEGSLKRQKAIRDAENLLRKEQERLRKNPSSLSQPA